MLLHKLIKKWFIKRKQRKQLIDNILNNKLITSNNINNNIVGDTSFELQSHTDAGEPFGWNRGTVRGMIAIVTSMTLCLLAIIGRLNNFYFLLLAGLILLSYFYSRLRLTL